MSSLAGNTYRRLIGALLAAVVCVVSGCVYAPQSPESRARTSPKAVQMPPGEGLLAVKVAINRPQVSPFFRKWNTLVLWNEDQQKEYRLDDRSDSSAMHAFFVDHLPPGKYNIRGLYSEAANGYYEFNSRANAKQVFPSFSIAADRMTDLGTIAYIRAHYPAVSNRYAWGQVYAPQDYPAKLRQ